MKKCFLGCCFFFKKQCDTAWKQTPFLMYFVIMTVSDSCTAKGRAGAPLDMEIAIIDAPVCAKIRTVMVWFLKYPINIFSKT